MRTLFISILLSGFILLPALAATEAGGLELRITFGEKITTFVLRQHQTWSYLLTFRNSDGVERKLVVSAQNARYLITKLQSEVQAQEASGACSRFWIAAKADISSSEHRRASACLGTDTPTARALYSLANLLATLI